MMRPFVLALVAVIAGGADVCLAQSNPLSAGLQSDYRTIRDYMIRAAEKMPEASYSFKPSPDVRTFGQQIAHVADDQYNLCSPVKGEVRKGAYRQLESSLTVKGDLVAALKAAFAYCDAAYAALTDSSATVMLKAQNRTRFGMLNWNLWHTWEHYGNIVVYLRMNGLVPPSSEPAKRS
ncbi:MAG TPA: DinB family protein [Gemmatimonadaceae bacterium]|jgi:uncharacterized damage-inducible protein DinB